MSILDHHVSFGSCQRSLTRITDTWVEANWPRNDRYSGTKLLTLRRLAPQRAGFEVERILGHAPQKERLFLNESLYELSPIAGYNEGIWGFRCESRGHLQGAHCRARMCGRPTDERELIPTER